jgi:thymidylate synthase
MGDLLDQGDEFGSRAGRTKELMHVGITLTHPQQREIVIPERKASVAAQIVETMWVLAGRDDVAGLRPYLPRAADFSDDGVRWRSGYGARLRNYRGGVDQLAYIVKTMTESPGSRQAVATLWDPAVDTTPGKDVTCNVALSFSSRFGYLDLHVFIRSNDAMWGWSGINAFEWSVLLEVVAGLAGLTVGALHFSTTSFHLYEQHWAKARRISMAGRWSQNDSPAFAGVKTLPDFDRLVAKWFDYEQLIRTGQPANCDMFPEPMMRSWLRVLQWYWSGDESYLEPLRGTALHSACRAGVAPAGRPQAEQLELPLPTPGRDFLTFVNRLHAEKHAAYGDSWKRRGEPGILGNIARKVDRLGSGQDTSDETQQDTAIDLLVYSAKYKCWLSGAKGDPTDVEIVLTDLEDLGRPTAEQIQATFELVENGNVQYVDRLLGLAYSYALSLW